MKIRIEGFGEEEMLEFLRHAEAAGLEVVIPPEPAEYYLFGPLATESSRAEAKALPNARIIELSQFRAMTSDEGLPVEEAPIKRKHRIIRRWGLLVAGVLLVIIIACVGGTLDSPAGGRFVYRSDMNGKVYHLRDCKSAEQIKEKAYSDDSAKLLRMGLRPCKHCLPSAGE